MNETYGKYILYAACLLPIPLWVVFDPSSVSVSGPADALKLLAKSSALVGMAAYVLMPVLSMRHPILERTLGSLDVVYNLHKSISKLSILLITLHPLLLLAATFIDRATYSVLWTWDSAVVWTGVITYLIMLVVLAITIYAHISHKRWVLIHRLFGWLIIPSFVHGLLAGKQLSNNSALFTYMLILGLVGMSAFIYRSLLAGFFVKKYHYRVAEVCLITDSITELTLKPVGLLPMPYQAGQFAYLSLQGDGIDPEAHPFSLTTAPNGPYLRFAIKELGDYTNEIEGIPVGTDAYLEGPYGDFSRGLSRKHHQVWIAGGIGIAPFLSLARSIGNTPVDIVLLYGVVSQQEAAFYDELVSIQQEARGSMQLQLIASDTDGYITPETIKQYVPDMLHVDYFICGPPAMHSSLKEGLQTAGVKPQRIHLEEFSLL